MIEQGSYEWKLIRCGKISASRISDIMAVGRSGPSVSRENYLCELAVERLTGNPTESYTSPAMAWGTENEDMARSAYEALKGVFVTEVTWVQHPTIKNAGCSPDGLVDDNLGLIEIKCPNTKTHVDYIIKNEPAKAYYNQMMWQMACTGRKYVDFVSYDPRMPVQLELFVARLERDDDYIKKLEEEVKKFDEEVTQLLNKLREMRNG